MLRPRWRKVLRDLVGNRTRMILVVLSIAVGVFAVGMIAGTQVVISRDLTIQYQSVNPAGATLFTDGFDDDFVDSMRRVRGVGDVQGRRSLNLRARLPSGQSKNVDFVVAPRDGEIRINKIRALVGTFPPAMKEILVERTSVDWMGVKVGDRITVEDLNGKQRELRVAGIVHDINSPPAPFYGSARAYANFDTIEWLGGPRTYNELNMITADNQMDKEHVKAVASVLQSKVEASGREVFFTYIAEPGKHPVDSAIQVLLTLLGVLGFLALLLSGFLVVNTISAQITQQTKQIGVMKAIGARKEQIVGMYLTTVLAYGAMALFVGVPLGSLAATGLSSYMASMLNFDVSTTVPPLHVFILEVAVGLAVPLLAALYPIISGTRITVRAALGAEGIGKGQQATGLIDRIVGSIRGLSRPMLLSLRNTFRRKGRLLLTLSTLTLGGAIFIAVVSVRESTTSTLDDALAYFGYDFEVAMNRSYRPEQLQAEALKVPGVVEAEYLAGSSVRRARPDGTESGSIFALALPAESSLIKPTIVEGRWLRPDDENAIVLNTLILKDEKDVKLGDEITLKLGDRDTTWQVVGIVRGVMTGPIAYANRPYFERVARSVGQARSLWIVTDKHDAASVAGVEKDLKERFKESGLRVRQTESMVVLRQLIQGQFDIIVVFLMVMAVLLAVVGGLGLMGTMSLNVLERTREIGVMRAVGASDGAVRQIFIVEGILIGLISWAVGALVALPLSRLLSDQVGLAFLQAPLSFTFSLIGTAIWLALVVALAALSSILPARSASRMSVRDVLAYE